MYSYGQICVSKYACNFFAATNAAVSSVNSNWSIGKNPPRCSRQPAGFVPAYEVTKSRWPPSVFSMVMVIRDLRLLNGTGRNGREIEGASVRPSSFTPFRG